MSKALKVLAYDLSLTNSGWVLGEVEDGQIKILEYGAIGTVRYSKRGTGFRLKYIANELTKLYTDHKPDVVVKERSFSNGRITATQQIFKVNGVWEMMTHIAGYDDFSEIPATTVKKAVTGNGRAGKPEVAEAVRELTGIQTKDNDVNDAIAVLYAYCKGEGLYND